MFFEVIDTQGTRHYINPEHVVRVFEGEADYDRKPCTKIAIEGGFVIETSEGLSRIIATCNEIREKSTHPLSTIDPEGKGKL